MKNYKIKNAKLEEYNSIESPSFAKYSTQLINLAARTAQATRPSVVGKLSDLFPQYQRESENISIEGWKNWYLEKNPDAIEKATRKTYEKMQEYIRTLSQIDESVIREWVEDLVFNKTFLGLYVQEAIIKFLAEVQGETDYRLANSEEESRGIDGFVGNKAYSVKPMSYKEEASHLLEVIDAYMVYYKKERDGLDIEVEDDENNS